MFLSDAIAESQCGIAKRETSQGRTRYALNTGEEQIEVVWDKYEGKEHLSSVEANHSRLKFQDWEPVTSEDPWYSELAATLEFGNERPASEKPRLSALVRKAILKRERITDLAQRIGEYGDWTELQLVKDLDDLIQAATDLRELL